MLPGATSWSPAIETTEGELTTLPAKRSELFNDAITLTRSAGGKVAAGVPQLWDSFAEDGKPGLPQMRSASRAAEWRRGGG